MSIYIGYATAPRGNGLPGGGDEGDVLTLDENGQPAWDAPTGGSGSGDAPEELTSVTGYTGGGATNLDGVTTVGVTAGDKLYYFLHSTGGYKFYKLAAGTTAESSPNVIRPDDYNASTNAKVWILVVA